MIDAVLSYHGNPLTCGVARFNCQLADRLGVPCVPITSRDYAHPLVSVKFSEWRWRDLEPFAGYSLFIHDAPYSAKDVAWVTGADAVYAGDPSIAKAVAHLRPDVIAAWCPATVTGDPTRGAYRVLVFGMSHKLLLPHFKSLKERLDREHPDYTIELSTAVHEGTPWDMALTDATTAMRALFGRKLRVLGFLGDDALAKELHDVDAVAAYYSPALRANNTSAWAALEAGKTLYTNTDADSPALDVAAHSWDALLSLMGVGVQV